MTLRWVDKFVKMESSAGLVLMAATAVALLAANSPLVGLHSSLVDTPVEFRFGAFVLAKPLLLWVNDGLMAVFFLLVALELKRELLVGHLSDRSQLTLPVVGAVAGMLAPAAVYFAFNRGDQMAMQGWAIPAATDIAFALGLLSLLGKRVPSSLRVFLLTLAIFDDLGAIVVIAVFYTGDLSFLALGSAAVLAVGLLVLNLRGVRAITPYVLVGAVLWVCVLKSGVHATMAGVLVGLAIPLRGGPEGVEPPLKRLEHALHPWVAFLILPIFALFNAAVPLSGLGRDALLHPVTLGIGLGLVVGKALGITAACWLAVKAGAAKLPEGANWRQLYGTAALCGVGFTMSLFIASLAFEHAGPEYFAVDRLGILLGSAIAAVHGLAVLAAGRREAAAAAA